MQRQFEDVFYAHRKQMLALAFSVLQNTEDAENVVCGVFLTVATERWGAVRGIRSNTDLGNYLLTEVKNAALDFARKSTTPPDTDDSHARLTDRDFLETVCRSAKYRQVVNAIDMIDSDCRDALYGHFVLEMTVPETARLLGRSVTATKSRICRGKEQLLAGLALDASAKGGDTPMRKAELKRAFREAAFMEFAHIPDEESIALTFSEKFTTAMDALLRAQQIFNPRESVCRTERAWFSVFDF